MFKLIAWKHWESRVIDIQDKFLKDKNITTGYYNFFTGQVKLSQIGREHKFSNRGIVQCSTKTDNWTETNTPPLVYKEWKIFGIEELSDDWLKKVKDQNRDEKLFYVLKLVVTKGWDYIADVEGKYAAVIISPKNEVYMIKKGISLFFDKNIICSEKFGKLEELEDDVVKGWTNRLIKKLKVRG